VDRLLPFTVTFNFRDVGGYTGLDGRTVRWRRLFRSDSLHRIGEPDREAFSALGIRTVIDLRRQREIDAVGRIAAEHAPSYRHIYPVHPEWDATTLDAQPEAARWLADRYMDLATEGMPAVGEALGVIADEDSAPVVVHCAAGKDRTGVVCAVTLGLLGVSDADITADYELSSSASARLADFISTEDPTRGRLPSTFLASPAAAMTYFLQDLRSTYGSVDGYALAAGLSAAQLDAMRNHLLND
jgi:protein-tyrosine phosphatase